MNKKPSFSKINREAIDKLVADMAYVKKRLEDAGADVYLSGGTLLGAVRDNDFIPWDWDVEYMVHTTNFKRKKFMREIQKDGYRISQFSLSGPPRIEVHSTVEIDIFEFKQEKDLFRRCHKIWNKSEMRIPASFFQNPAEITFKGIRFLVPSPVQDFLAWRYGDWQNPHQSSRSKKTYLTDSFSPNRHKKKKKGLIYYTLKWPRKIAKMCDMLIVKTLGFKIKKRFK